ncbi:uncharacterized protein DUF2480 [Maribacter spongiicola]|uniref:Uncharacterized protein DUF2480 n=1 Tax=Maribacter spongiicola TaxID=1206753 RepID=A0A4R7K5E8_9FLAO|nr:DUF2480 family protein [Maribacter spongiicola]TDT46447.1 uncharacterized protein DUF2480 [Maribacter spongiicola]
MQEEIVNKVAQSKLITFNLEDYYPKGNRVVLDIKDWLFEGFILKEKDFRSFVEAHDWSQYEGAYVAMHCSTDAIVPGWAYLLLSVKLSGIAKKAIQGSLVDLETSIYQSVIENIDVSQYQDKLIIVKGCSKKPVPANAYLFLAERLKPVAKSIMYGEACSSVPLYKRK